MAERVWCIHFVAKSMDEVDSLELLLVQEVEIMKIEVVVHNVCDYSGVEHHHKTENHFNLTKYIWCGSQVYCHLIGNG